MAVARIGADSDRDTSEEDDLDDGQFGETLMALTAELGRRYETQSSLEAAASLLNEQTGWPTFVMDANGGRIAGTATGNGLALSKAHLPPTSRTMRVGEWLCQRIPTPAGYVLCVQVDEHQLDGEGRQLMNEIVALTAFELCLEESTIHEHSQAAEELALLMLLGTDRQRISMLASVVGHDLAQIHRVGLLADGQSCLSASQVRLAVRRSGHDALVAPWGSSIAVVLSGGANPEAILDALDDVSTGGRRWIGLSAPRPDGYDLGEAVKEAGLALSFSQVARGSRMISYRDLGVFRLFSLDGQWAQLEEFVIETLGPLISYDHDHGSELVRTLDAYLRRNGSLNQLAEVLVIHRSTLTYRLRRIRELLDVDIDDSSLRLELSLAARAVEVLYAAADHNLLLDHLQGLDVPLSVANGFLE